MSLWVAALLVCACARQEPPPVSAEPPVASADAPSTSATTSAATTSKLAQPPSATPPGHPAGPPWDGDRRPLCDPASPCPGGAAVGEQCGRVSAGCPGVYATCACVHGAACTSGRCVAVADAGPAPPPHAANTCSIFDHAGYDQAQRDIKRLSAEATKANREAMQKYGRNDGPQARAQLDPVLQKLSAAQARLRLILTGGVQAVADTKAFFHRLGIPVSSMGRPDAKAVDALITRHTRDGRLTPDCARELRFVIDERTRHITNPTSRGAPVVAQNTAQSLAMFGLDY